MSSIDKMKLIYKHTGIESNHYRSRYEGALVPIKSFNDLYRHKQEPGILQHDPYYTAEQLWGMLPHTLEVEGKTYFLQLKGLELSYIEDQFYRSALDNYLYLKFFSPKYSIQEILLDMVIWCIDKGYIKGVKEEDNG